MIDPRSKRRAAILCATHALALLIGVGVGYWHGDLQRTETTSLIEALADRPLAEAAELAFRFGTEAHASALHTELRDGDALSVYYRELKLAFLDGEHVASAGKDAHLVRAAAACKRFGMLRCDVPHLRKSAENLAKMRSQ